MPPGIIRFFKYALVGGSTFAFDLVLLFVLVDYFKMNEVVAAGVAFVIAVSINYLISRTFVFKGTKQGLKTGYINFIIIALIGLLIVTSGMYLMTVVLQWNYLASRVIVAGFTGCWNYLMNLFVNFKVAGKH
jgi:putative flippase GtrA